MRGLTMSVLVGLALLLAGDARASSAAGPAAPGDLPPEMLALKHPTLDWSLLAAVPAAQDGSRRRGTAQAYVTGAAGEERVRVIAEVSALDRELRSHLEDLSLQVEGRYHNLVQMLVPPASLEALAAVPGVEYVRPPLRWQADEGQVLSQGVGLTRAKEWLDSGVRGQGIKIGVLDAGFLGYQARLCRDLPCAVVVKSFRADGNLEASDHGTAVAEIIRDMAPEANLYLVNFDTEVEWEQAVDWLLQQGVQIINQSAGWVDGPFDGTDFRDRKVDDVRRKGILWVNAAGNYAQSHWEGRFRDTDGDGWHEFFPGLHFLPIGVPLPPIGVPAGALAITLTWDEWPRSTSDYDLCLFDAAGIPLTCSVDGGSGGQHRPLERISGSASPGSKYWIGIKRYQAVRPVNFKLYLVGAEIADPQLRVPSRSLSIPATAWGGLAVGAARPEDRCRAAIPAANCVQPYSSRGPTSDGRLKPDLVAPDCVSTTLSTPQDPFCGTSAAAPHVSGAAALLWSAHPRQTAEEVRAALLDRAIPLRDGDLPGRNIVSGLGLLNLGPAPYLQAVGGDVRLASGVAVAFGVGKHFNGGVTGWMVARRPGWPVFQSTALQALETETAPYTSRFVGAGRFADTESVFPFTVTFVTREPRLLRLTIALPNGQGYVEDQGAVASGALQVAGTP